jgi:hypothetical protein
MKPFLAILFATMLLVVSIAGQTASKRGMVANLENQRVADGCGCYFRFRGTPVTADQYMFFSSIEDDEKSAWMNIDGRDVKLQLTKKVDAPRGERVGMRSTRRYEAEDVFVDATYVVTRVCRRNDESCESTGYAATFVLRKGSKRQLAKAVGSCGC